MGKSGGSGSSSGKSKATSYNYGSSDGYNFGQSVNNSLGENFQQSNSLSNTYLNPEQAAHQQDLIARATKLADSGINLGFDSSFQQLNKNLGLLSDPTKAVDARLTGLRSGLDDQFARGLNQIGANATQAGAFGGARHGLQEAALGGEIAKAYTQGYGDIMSQAQSQALGANTALGQTLGQQRSQGLQEFLAPLEYLRQSIGNPAILSQSLSSGSGYGYDTSAGGSLTMGQDTSMYEGGSESKSKNQAEESRFGVSFK